MVYDINKDLFREKYIVPMKKNFKSFYRLVRKNSIITKFFYEKKGIFRFRFRDTDHAPALRNGDAASGRRRVHWPIDLDTAGVFNSFDRNIQRISEDYLADPSLNSLDNKRERDNNFV